MNGVPEHNWSVAVTGKQVLARCSSIFLMSLLIWLSVSFGPSVAQDREATPVRIDVGGYYLNSILIEAGRQRDLPPIVFIHGASTSLYDPVLSFRKKLEGRATLLFVDRPGHGRSDPGGSENILPDGQADAIATLMEKRGIGRAIIVGHSLGGAIAAALAMRHPDKIRGLVFLSPAVYPWSSGVAWYYDAARAPITGALFSTFVVPPLGVLAINRAAQAVFAPNPPPPDTSGISGRCRLFVRPRFDTMREKLQHSVTGRKSPASAIGKSRLQRSSSPAIPTRSSRRTSMPDIWRVIFQAPG